MMKRLILALALVLSQVMFLAWVEQLRDFDRLPEKPLHLVTFVMIDALDHLSPLRHAHPAVSLSVNGERFYPSATNVRELNYGVYATRVPMRGHMIIMVRAPGADTEFLTVEGFE